MKSSVLSILILVAQLFGLNAANRHSNRYPWLETYRSSNSINHRFAAPNGYVRLKAESGSFADWLRKLPLKPGNPPVLMYNGVQAAYQDYHCAVVDIDVGTKNLQQCADAIIRLRAEYLYSIGRIKDIDFNFTSGDRADYGLWIEGYRPLVNGSDVTWKLNAAVDSSYNGFREYLDAVFAYAGTYSLSRDLKPVGTSDSIQAGDILVIPGFPGHAVMVADVAIDTLTNEKALILIQGFSPAQDVHVLKSNDEKSPWFVMPADKPLRILWYDFDRKHIRRF